MEANARDRRGSCALRSGTAMQEVHSALAPGTLVRARGEFWHVRDTRRFGRAAVVTLDAAEATNPQRTTTLLLPFDRVEPAVVRRPARRRRHVVVRAAIHALSEACPAHGLWTARTARMDLLPWQLAPALAVLGGATRLLLADAVGLGKTVQAGLVLAELRARGLVRRALILTPPALRADWAAELGTRFDLPVTVFDLPAIQEVERRRGVGVNPWSGTPVIVSSLDLVKRADVLGAVEGAPLDLLIVDEVHRATPGTDRYAAVSRLARAVPWVVLVSATPHSGETAAYRALLGLGEVGTPSVDRLNVFRRSYRDVRVAVERRTHVLRVRPSREEDQLQAAVLAYVRDLCRTLGAATSEVPLLAAVLARRATSSPVAIHRTLTRRLDRLNGVTPAPGPQSLALPWEELDEEDGEPWLSVAGFADVAAERRRVHELVSLAKAAESRWSKGLRLRRLVQAIGEPVIVFSEFRDSLDACRAVLEPTTTLVELHGGVDAGERRARIARFIDGHARVLLATDVAGEGLNLQAPSRLVVTLEWPWNPVRIEQRVGRVHRLGQSRTVHAIHLTLRHSYEDTVVAHALGRAARATADLAAIGNPTESTVTAAVLGLCWSAAAPETPGRSLGPASPDVSTGPEAVRLARLRRWADLGRPLPTSSGAWARPPHGPSTARLVAVVEVRRTIAGSPRSCHVVPIEIRLRIPPADRRQWRLVCRKVAADPRVHQAAIAATETTRVDDPWPTAAARLAAILDQRRTRRPPTVQPSLFDRRALRQADGVSSTGLAWDRWQQQLERCLRGHRDPPAITTRVVALLPMAEGSA